MFEKKQRFSTLPKERATPMALHKYYEMQSPEEIVSLPPASSIVRHRKQIAKLEESAFTGAKQRRLPTSHSAMIGRLAEGDRPLQESLVSEFDKKTANQIEAEAFVNLFVGARAKNRVGQGLFLMEDAVSHY